MRTVGSVLLFWLVAVTALVALLFSDDYATGHPSITLSGQMVLLWGDGASPEGTTAVLLVPDDGQPVWLDVPAERAYNLDRQKVTVTGEWSEAVDGSRRYFDVITLETAAKAPRPNDWRHVDGAQPWLTILCKYADRGQETYPLDFYQTMYTAVPAGLDHYWRESSYDRIDLTGSHAVGWYTLPHGYDYYINGIPPRLDDMFNDCTAAADNDVFYGDYVGVNLMFNDDMRYSWGGSQYGTLDGISRWWRTTWIADWGHDDMALMTHEMGHGFGLPHSSGQYGQTYDNEWDVMSSIYSYCDRSRDPVYGCLGQHTIGFHKELLGWITAAEVFTATAETRAQVTLDRLAWPADEGVKLIKLYPQEQPSGPYYTLEARQWSGYDVRLPGEAVIIHSVPEATAFVIDDDWDGDTGDDGAMWTEGETFSDPTGVISVTVDQATPNAYILTIGALPFSCQDQADIPPAECEALVSLYQNNGGHSWLERENWLFDSPCQWQGVNCDQAHVTSLVLSGNQLTGTLLLELTNLTHLLYLDLSANQLVGELSGEFISSLELQWLDLSSNGLSGLLPDEIGGSSSLLHLDLSANGFSGPLPEVNGGLDQVRLLNLAGNNLEGALPLSWGGLTNLVTLNLADNELSGLFPEVVGNLDQLQIIDLSQNDFTGSLPAALHNLTQLQIVVLAGNALNGQLSPSLINAWPELRQLDLHNNQFDGGLPANIVDRQQLTLLDLADNLFQGELPAELSQLEQLQTLSLAGNQFTGGLPAGMGQMEALQELILADNALSGPLPAELGQLSALRQLDLSDNQLSGTLPAALGDLENSLIELSLSGNRFDGALPVEVAGLHGLSRLGLARNGLVGTIPTALLGMTQLLELELDYNALWTDSPSLRNFLALHQPDWAATQTVPPQHYQVDPSPDGDIRISWVPIDYQADGGYYEISLAEQPAGPYNVVGTTADKISTEYVITGLDPDSVTYFLLRTFTPAHPGQDNDLWSVEGPRIFTPAFKGFLPLVGHP